MRRLIDRIRRKTTVSEVDIEMADYRLLFVCMGNICRSPTAEGAFRSFARERAPDLRIHVDSAGTHAYHSGEPPDARARRAAERRGIDLSGLRARRIVEEDFARFDMILAMDLLNLEALRDRCPGEYQGRLHLLLDFAEQSAVQEIPDPYYGGLHGFERVLDLVEEASAGLLEHLRTRT